MSCSFLRKSIKERRVLQSVVSPDEGSYRGDKTAQQFLDTFGWPKVSRLWRKRDEEVLINWISAFAGMTRKWTVDQVRNDEELYKYVLAWGSAKLRRMKLMIWIGITLGGLVGGWLGGLLDHGNWLGGWSILFSVVGSLVGIWVGYKANEYIQ